MIYLLDTNTCIGYINRRNNSIYQRITSLSPEEVVICDIVKFELYYGAYNSSRTEENLATLNKFFGDVVSLPFDGKAAAICGYLRSQLKTQGTPIGSYDLQIAAIALTNNLTLVTHNTREFSRIPELKLEDWENV
ncbi:MAG: type II toxin-antitoxin system VapC family toxin [Sphaerospermopsis kisseleviana]|jgi:tRNA(fMet)-specific endonuclease VapC|uniref:Ribonuclease VapC n=2 Tax=Sphaerospermopsis TaxID=752201 RepID=A0A479ZWQ3_9CYAN|nr:MULTISPECIES: type II toxin-antitoxin system VapC family toxin [Sphaerospermopsis]MBD2147280.1 type II toxin-antitoxin system VapC family toxin [Sphaerospermopsis sp. FACHB-1194]MDB9443097.1 type II toxin-antitoxin system VapC family toxin [Sphaerospermopsis kisseleviana CS-549]BAZ79310.1 PIN domain protein [Sphaerospermopsis kisseleviana NIES-73]GCL37129.1 PIN domain protein [Sphaerospermopsis reniformis]